MVSVIIPTYNESESIKGIISAILKEVHPLKEIIVVDDDSPDMTWQLVEEMRKEDKRIKLIHRLSRDGLPSAIREGILGSQGDIILWLDADFLSLPLTQRGFLDNLNNHDIIVASRYVNGGRDDRREKIRVIASRLFNRLAKFILKTDTRDLTSGYIIARREIFNRINISGLYGEYCIRFLYQAERNNMHIKEVPYVCLSRTKGNSKTAGNIFLFIKYSLIYILTVFKLRLFENAPKY